MPQEGVGVALGAQVGHVVTWHGSPEGSPIYTNFTKKCQKTVKRETPVFNRVFECTRIMGSFPARRLAETQNGLGFWPSDGGQKRLLGVCSPIHPLKCECIPQTIPIWGGAPPAPAPVPLLGCSSIPFARCNLDYRWCNHECPRHEVIPETSFAYTHGVPKTS